MNKHDSKIKLEKKSVLKTPKFYFFLALIATALGLTILFYIYKTQIGDITTNPEDAKKMSLLLASVIIGLLDGFNPCAMWVLIYLITLVSTLQDKRKMFLIVGTFIITEAIMYFGVLMGWLSVMSFVGISGWFMYIIGAFALWFGLKNVYDYIKNNGQIQCEVGDIKTRQKTISKIKSLVNSPLSWVSVGATIILAIVVNSFEFLCSWQFVSVYTSMLNVVDITLFQKVFYVLVYDFFFMVDDFIIFGLALLAIQSNIMDKYAGLSKLIGGIIMIALGIILLFFPNLL